ncbi:MAG: CPBP family intramembrane metalloprotease [Clostridia bacterium]|nr:CPBP family intramembrane metalloprotease [Clostridia bacterium]
MQKTGTVGAAMLLLWLIVRFFGSYLPGDAAAFGVQILAALLPLLLLLPLSREERGEGSVTLSSPNGRAWAHFWLLPLFLLCVMILSILSAAFAGLFGIGSPAPTGSLPILFLNYALAPAFAEEFFFRFVLFRLFLPHGKQTAVWISAILFALVHMNLAQIPYALAGGLFLGALAASSESFWIPFLFHLTNNTLSLLLSRADGIAPLAVIGALALTAALFLHFRSPLDKESPERTTAAAFLPDKTTGKNLRVAALTPLLLPALLCLVVTFLPI